MLLPRQLDPVEAGRDTPLPPERPSAFGFNLGTTMEDPTAVEPADGATVQVVPEVKPAIAPAPAPKAKIRQKK
jgi:hypothetical protein